MRLKALFDTVDEVGIFIDRPYIIAEAGVNHECEIDNAKRLILDAAEGGASGIKFQTYKADTLASKNAMAYWDLNEEPSKSQHQLFSKYDKFWKTEFEILKKLCDEVGIEFLSSPFDIQSAVFLNDLMDVFKISSSDITNKPFIELIANFGKPIILSTGASYIEEIARAVNWIESCEVDVALLHCILNYPTLDQNANLGMILDLKRNFPDKIVGYSDHTMPGNMKNLEVATLLGAKIIEKHFTFDKGLKGNDHYHAMDKFDLSEFVKNLDELMLLVGDQEKHPIDSEELSRNNARRSLVSSRRISRNSVIRAEDLTYKRPGTGISPDQFDLVVGSVALLDIDEDVILEWDMVRRLG